MNNKEYLIDKTQEDMVFAISLVENPANETEFMLFNKEEEEVVKLSAQDRQIVTGVVLIPGQPIKRKYGALKFTEAAIEDLSIKFYQNGYQTNANFQHENSDEIHDLVYFESWIVTDPENDKSNALGFKNLPKGTWMASAKIDSESTWQRIKSGEVKGFSIEAFLTKTLNLQIEENNITQKLNKEEMSLLKELTKIFTKLSETESTQLESIYTVGQQLENKGVEYSFEEAGYKVDVDANGVVTAVTEIVPVDAPVVDEVVMSVEADAAVEVIDADTEQISAEVEKPVEVVDIEALRKTIADLQAQVDILEAEKAKLNDMVTTLSKEPVTTKLSANEVSTKSETRLEFLERITKK